MRFGLPMGTAFYSVLRGPKVEPSSIERHRVEQEVKNRSSRPANRSSQWTGRWITASFSFLHKARRQDSICGRSRRTQRHNRKNILGVNSTKAREGSLRTA